MKFQDQELGFVDVDGDQLHVSVHPEDYDEFLFIGINHWQAISMSLEEARKFAKALRKEVKKALNEV